MRRVPLLIGLSLLTITFVSPQASAGDCPPPTDLLGGNAGQYVATCMAWNIVHRCTDHLIASRPLECLAPEADPTTGTLLLP